MRLFLMRHGIAARPQGGQADRERPLTAEGSALMRLQAGFLERSGYVVDRLLSSPYLRARQTAALLAPALGVMVDEEALLVPSCSLRDLDEVLGHYGHPGRVMVVSHQPALGQMVYQLTGAETAMRPGTLAVIETARIRPKRGVLLGLYEPGVMARLGKEG